MIKEIVAIAKAKFHFNVTCKLQERAARQRLEAYVKTLSPEKQEWARKLRAELEKSPEQSAGILRRETARLNEQHMRVIEKIDVVHRKFDAVTKVTD